MTYINVNYIITWYILHIHNYIAYIQVVQTKLKTKSHTFYHILKYTHSLTHIHTHTHIHPYSEILSKALLKV